MGIITRRLDEFKNEERVLELTNVINSDLPPFDDCRVYPNQVNCGIEVLKKFDDNFPRPNHVVVKGETQSGKTGVLTSIIMLIKHLKLNRVMSVERIIYITGDNGCRLRDQTEKRVRDCFNDDGFMCQFICMKNSDMNTDKTNKYTLTNAIIFIDESHYGVNKEKNVLNQWLDSKGLNMHNQEDLVEKHIYIISNSATPYWEMVSDIANSKALVNLDTYRWDGQRGYVGFKELNARNVIQGMPHQVKSDEIEDFCILSKQKLVACYNDTRHKKCVIMRIGSDLFNKCKTVMEQYFRVEKFAASAKNIQYAEMYLEMLNVDDDKSEINEWKPLCIVIHGAFRMGISIPMNAKKNIGVVCDFCGGEAKNGAAITTEQGLLGRLTGYWDNDEWKRMTIFINMKHIKTLNAYYIEKSVQSTLVSHKPKNVPCEDGDVLFVEDDGSPNEISSNLRITDDDYNLRIKEFLEAQNPKYKELIFINGRRNSEKQKTTRSKPSFSKAQHGVEKYLKDFGNDGKRCYTTLYDSSSGMILVLFGTIRRGKEVETAEETKKIIKTLETYK